MAEPSVTGRVGLDIRGDLLLVSNACLCNSYCFLCPTGQKSCLSHWLLIKEEKMLCLAPWCQKAMLSTPCRPSSPGIHIVLLVPIHCLVRIIHCLWGICLIKKTKVKLKKISFGMETIQFDCRRLFLFTC